MRTADLDGDGDQDVLSASWGDDRIAWYENTDGAGHFGTPQLITTDAYGAVSVYAADLDSDGDLDVIAAAGSKVAWYENRLVGDANDEGAFNSSDMVQVFQAGEYEDGFDGNSTFDKGDWDGDGDFTTSDMVMAFQSGLYEVKSQPIASEVSAAIDWLFAQDDGLRRGKAFIA